MSKAKNVDMTNGPIMKNLVIYAIPVVLSSVVLLLFNAIDVAVVGKFVSDDAVAAVGANASLNALFVAFFLGFSVGSNVVLAKYVGAKDKEGAERTVGTSIVIAIASGVLLMIIGLPMAETFLIWMKCDPRILPDATIYLKYYFINMPTLMLYNFTSAILRATGDSRRPLIYLSIGGVIKIALNIFFVVVCKMSIDGVGISTIISKLVSCSLCVIVLFKNNDYASITWKNIRIYKTQLKEILAIGIPSGVQSIMYNIANIALQTKVNSLGAEAMSANTASGQFDSIVYQVGNSIAIATMIFVGQNVGAKNMQRVKQALFRGVILASSAAFGVGAIFAIFSKWLCSLMVSDPLAIELASQKLTILGLGYFICSGLEVCSNSVRAMGKPNLPLIISLVCACIIKVAVLEVTFFFVPKFFMVYLNNPINYIIIAIVYAFVTPWVYKQLKAKIQAEENSLSVRQ